MSLCPCRLLVLLLPNFDSNPYITHYQNLIQVISSLGSSLFEPPYTAAAPQREYPLNYNSQYCGLNDLNIPPHNHEYNTLIMTEGRCNCGSIHVSIPALPEQSAICYWYVGTKNTFSCVILTSTALIAAAPEEASDPLFTSSINQKSQSRTLTATSRATRIATRKAGTLSPANFVGTVDGKHSCSFER
jgi:hypothetical protein